MCGKPDGSFNLRRGAQSERITKHDEADYYQSMLDRLLRQAYGDEIQDGFYGFSDRYDVKKFDYQTGKWR